MNWKRDLIWEKNLGCFLGLGVCFVMRISLLILWFF